MLTFLKQESHKKNSEALLALANSLKLFVVREPDESIRMKNSESEQSFFIESDEEDAETLYDSDEENGNGFYSSNYSNNNDRDGNQHNRADSLNTLWPQSYRKSIDLYGSVPSPSNNFLGPSSIMRLGSSFLSRRHTSELLPSLSEPLIEDGKLKEKQSSHSLLPPLPTRKPSLKKVSSDRKSVAHELPISGRSSFGQAVLNGINVLCGVGILSTPYAVKEGGWLGLSILIMFGILSFYTGLLLRRCLDSQPGLETYPDIGQAAFGTIGRIVISIILYVELYASCVEYIILESDNLSSLFPNAHLSVGALDLNSHHLFALISTLVVLPTVWLRDFSVLSYLSAGGVIASVLVVACLFWAGVVDHVGVPAEGTMLNLSNLPVAIGLYGYCYSGHAVFPNIYTSLEKRNQFPVVLLTSFAICTVMYAGVAFMGYTMFGESTDTQFTLNMPKNLLSSKIAVWTTVVNPFTKYALTISPVALSLEELIPARYSKSHMYSILIRTVLVISTLLAGLSIPFFDLVMALIGSLLTMLVTLILPCACYLSILRGKINLVQGAMCVSVIAVGVTSSAFGSYSALAKIIEKLS